MKSLINTLKHWVPESTYSRQTLPGEEPKIHYAAADTTATRILATTIAPNVENQEADGFLIDMNGNRRFFDPEDRYYRAANGVHYQLSNNPDRPIQPQGLRSQLWNALNTHVIGPLRKVPYGEVSLLQLAQSLSQPFAPRPIYVDGEPEPSVQFVRQDDTYTAQILKPLK